MKTPYFAKSLSRLKGPHAAKKLSLVNEFLRKHSLKKTAEDVSEGNKDRRDKSKS